MGSNTPRGTVIRNFIVQRGRQGSTDLWMVALPHQCDYWDIAGETYYGQGVPHAEAIANLEGFISEGVMALNLLRERVEVLEADDDEPLATLSVDDTQGKR